MSKQNATTASLLASLQDRITAVSDKARKTADALEAHKDYTRVQFGDFANTIDVEGDFAALDSEIKAVDAKIALQAHAAREELRSNATGTTYALNALKDSTQRGFNGITDDIKSVQSALQKFNARIAATEGQLAKLEEDKDAVAVNTTSALEADLKALLTRYGYRVHTVSIGKTNFEPISGGMLGLLQNQQGGGSESLEVKITGSKPL